MDSVGTGVWLKMRSFGAGMLTTLTEWEERNAASALEQSMTLVEALAAQETCPLQALDYAAALDWQPLKVDGDKVDMARVQSFQAFVVAVKVRSAHMESITYTRPSPCKDITAVLKPKHDESRKV